MAASRRAHPAKLAKSHIIERGSATEDDTTAFQAAHVAHGHVGVDARDQRAHPGRELATGPRTDRTKSAIDLGIWRSSATACGYGMYRAPVISAGARPDRVYWRTSPTTPTTVRQSRVPDHPDALPDGVLARPVPSRRGRAHDHHRRRPLAVGVVEGPPLQERDAHEPEVGGRDRSRPEQGRDGLGRPRGDVRPSRPEAAAGRRSAEACWRPRPRPRRSCPARAAAARRRGRRRPTAPRTSTGSGETRTVSVCSGRNPGSAWVSPQRVRMRRPAPTARTTASATSAAMNEPRRRVPPGAVARWPSGLHQAARSTREALAAGARPKRSPHSTREAGHERQDPGVDADGGEAAGVGGKHRLQSRERAQGQGDPEPSAQEREGDTFGEQLAQDPAAAGAEGGPQRHLLPARGRARQEEARDVRARDQEDDPDRRLQHQQLAADVAHEVLLQRRRPSHRRSSSGPATGTSRRSGRSSSAARPGPARGSRPGGGGPRAASSRTPSSPPALLGIEPQRHPELRRARWEMEPGRHHAHDLPIHTARP